MVLVVTALFCVALRNVVRRVPLLFYALAVLVVAVFVFGAYVPLPRPLWSLLLVLVQKCLLPLALFAVVMFIGVLPGESRAKAWLRPVRAELSIVAWILSVSYTHLDVYKRQVRAVRDRVRELAGPAAETVVVSAADPASVEAVRALVPAGTTAVFIGKSGVGKSSLVNLLVGHEVQETAEVREGDGKGRHTTVSREMIPVPAGGFVVDMPGVRGLGLWDADAGIEAAFADVEQLAEQCRFRDCRHLDEPGCAVRAAVDSGELSEARFASYQGLRQETAQVKERREEARRLRGEKASTSGKRRPPKSRKGKRG